MGCTPLWEKIEWRDTCWRDSSNSPLRIEKIQRSSLNKTRLKAILGLLELIIWFDAKGEWGGALWEGQANEQLDSNLVEENKKRFH